MVWQDIGNMIGGGYCGLVSSCKCYLKERGLLTERRDDDAGSPF